MGEGREGKQASQTWGKGYLLQEFYVWRLWLITADEAAGADKRDCKEPPVDLEVALSPRCCSREHVLCFARGHCAVLGILG